MKEEILKKYLNNSCTDREFDVFAEWIKKEVAINEGKKWVLDDWKLFKHDLKNIDQAKYNALLNKIHHEINLKEHRKSRGVTIAKVTSWLSRAAAILFLPLLGVMLYMYSNNNFKADDYTDLAVDSLEIIAPIGSRTVLQLSDGTEVHLNYGSKIEYPRNFSGDTREITLTGEGYFKVAHNQNKSFIVRTEQIDVKALGTEFNVCAYPNDDFVATTLVNGKVVIDKILTENKTKKMLVMVPEEHLAYNLKSGKVTRTKGGIDKYIAWKDGKLVFDNEPITRIAEKLSRMYNVDIEVADNIKDYTYTVTLVNDPLLLILDLMTEVTDITYKAFPREKLADGTFSKQKIRIEKRH